MHLFAAVDDERLLAGDSRIGADRERNLKAFSRSAQMAALVVEDVERDVGAVRTTRLWVAPSSGFPRCRAAICSATDETERT